MKIQTEKVDNSSEIDVKAHYRKQSDVVRRMGMCSMIKIYYKENGTHTRYMCDEDKKKLPSFCFVTMNDEFLDPYPQPSPIYYSHVCIEDLIKALDELGYTLSKK